MHFPRDGYQVFGAVHEVTEEPFITYPMSHPKRFIVPTIHEPSLHIPVIKFLEDPFSKTGMSHRPTSKSFYCF